jgi:hypothetical protein
MLGAGRATVIALVRLVQTLRRQARRRPRLTFEIGLALCTLVLLAAVYALRIVPLAEAPKPPPPGIELAWAGSGLTGYSVTGYLLAPRCPGRATLILEAYPNRRLSAAEEATASRPGLLGFAVRGDPELRPRDISIWAIGEGSELLSTLLGEGSAPVPSPLRPHGGTRFEALESPRSWVAESFGWDPRKAPRLVARIEADWVTERTEGASCWLEVPGVLGGEAETEANEAIGHREWTRSFRGMPVQSAAMFVNDFGQTPLRVEPEASAPPPGQLDPPS